MKTKYIGGWINVEYLKSDYGVPTIAQIKDIEGNVVASIKLFCNNNIHLPFFWIIEHRMTTANITGFSRTELGAKTACKAALTRSGYKKYKTKFGSMI